MSILAPARSFLAASLVVACTAPALASEAELNARWRGAWVLIGADTFSGCGGNFTNNEVRGLRVQSKGAYRFSAGELGSVYKINLHRRRVEVLLELAEPLLAPRQDGPFTLYDELDCKVELRIGLPRGASGDDVEELIASLIERHETRDAAEAAEAWNGRVREPYPDNYDEVLFEHQLWRAEQLNVEVADRIDEAIEEAARLVDRLDDDSDYLAGFAEGVDRARDRHFGEDCDRLLSKTVRSFVDGASRGDSEEWRDGYRDGQRLVFYLESSRRLRRCFVPVPAR